MRYFIIAPTLYGNEIYKVCSTKSNYRFCEIYDMDLYEEVEQFGTLKEAKDFARKEFGCKRPFVLE